MTQSFNMILPDDIVTGIIVSFVSEIDFESLFAVDRRMNELSPTCFVERANQLVSETKDHPIYSIPYQAHTKVMAKKIFCRAFWRCGGCNHHLRKANESQRAILCFGHRNLNRHGSLPPVFCSQCYNIKLAEISNHELFRGVFANREPCTQCVKFGSSFDYSKYESEEDL